MLPQPVQAASRARRMPLILPAQENGCCDSQFAHVAGLSEVQLCDRCGFYGCPTHRSCRIIQPYHKDRGGAVDI